jgi:UDP-N-acetylmuramoylalanine--D-glutamate ligase
VPKYQEFFAGKRVTLMGLGLLGRGLGDARFLAQMGAELIVTDLKTEDALASSLAELKGFSNITFHLGGHRLEDFQNRDLVIKAAGVPLDSPFVIEAKKNNIPVRMSADLFAELSGAQVVGVTGTRGKSTVTHLIAHILKQAGREVLLGGNVRGVSTLELLAQVTPQSIAVLELDSWQLQGFGDAKLSPHVAVFTTFMPDHMNYYKNNMEAYFADKASIFSHQTADDFLIIGEQVFPFIHQYGYESLVKAHTTTAGATSVPITWQLKIPGQHNRYNAGLAIEAARVVGIEEGAIKEAIESFEGVPGRLQLIKEIRGIKIYNDTTATVPEATSAAIEALGDTSKKNIILIMGGADKNLDMQPLLQKIPTYCKKVLLLAGTGTERIKKDISDAVVYDSLNSEIQAAFAAAESGDIVLLSPAFASFGMFKNEYDRGEQFDALVKNI